MSNYLPPSLIDPDDDKMEEDEDDDDFSDAPDPLEDFDDDTEVGEESADSVWPEDYPNPNPTT